MKTFLALASGVALSALAQAAAAQALPSTQTSPPASANAATPAASEIVVTATKRPLRLQDVPSTVDVINGDQLTRQNVAEVPDLVRSTPSLNTSGPFGALSIRGIGSIGFSRSSEGSVGVVLDNVALGATSITPPQLFDVARVEVLEGPQGTLFGRNSSAGVLNIVTNAPDPSKFEAAAHADIGSRNGYIAHALVNIPVADDAALRVTASYNQQPDVLKNLADGSSTSGQDAGVRARFLWDPASTVTVNMIGDYDHNLRTGGVPWATYYSTPGSILAQLLAACGVHVSQTNDQGCTNGGNEATIETFGFSNQIDWRIGQGFTLTSISAYRGVRQTTELYDVDNLPITLLNQPGFGNVDNVSQEFRLTSPTGRFFDYVVGLYYFDGEYNGATTQLGPILTFAGLPFPLGQTLATKASSTSYAAFGQGTIHFTSKFRINLGLRIDHENVDATTVGTLAPGAVAPIANISGTSGSVSDTDVSYKIGAQYDFTHNLMGYASYTRGYKGPAVNDQAAGPGIPVIVQPEIPHAYELGIKSSWFNGRLAANASVFYTKVNNFQTQYFDPALSAFIYGNAPSLTSKGAEIDVLGRPFSGLTLHAGAAYTNAKYGAGYVVTCSQGETAAQGCMPITVGGVVVGTGDDAGGNRLVGSPVWKGTFSAEYERPINDRFSGFVQMDAVYTGPVNWDQAYDPILRTPGATIVGGRLGLRTNDDKYSVSLFVRNLFDVYRPLVRFANPTSAEEGDPQSYVQGGGPESRRIIGVSLDAKF